MLTKKEFINQLTLYCKSKQIKIKDFDTNTHYSASTIAEDLQDMLEVIEPDFIMFDATESWEVFVFTEIWKNNQNYNIIMDWDVWYKWKDLHSLLEDLYFYYEKAYTFKENLWGVFLFEVN